MSSSCGSAEDDSLASEVGARLAAHGKNANGRNGLPGSSSCPDRAARHLERAGASRSAAMAMVGHKTESIYWRDAIVDAGGPREPAAKIDHAAGTISGTMTGT